MLNLTSQHMQLVRRITLGKYKNQKVLDKKQEEILVGLQISDLEIAGMEFGIQASDLEIRISELEGGTTNV